MSVKTAPWTSDIWAEYARLKSLGWIQQRVAKAKDVDRSVVSRRLVFHTMPSKVKDFVARGLLDEGHLREIITCVAQPHFSPWLTTSPSMGGAGGEGSPRPGEEWQQKLGKTRNEEILDLYLEGWTEAEIGRKLLIAQKTVSNVIADSKKGINSQITIPDPPQIGDVWLFANCDDDYDNN